FTSDYLKEVKILPSMLKILLAAFLMYGALYFIKTFINFSSVVNVLICSVLGFLVYGGLVLILRILDFQELKSIIKK
ncbi:MAG: flippase, partial [Streptococcus sp.]